MMNALYVTNTFICACYNITGAVAVKRLNVTDPTPSQLQAFKNEVAVLRLVGPPQKNDEM